MAETVTRPGDTQKVKGIVFSATRLRTYMECGLQAYFQYVEHAQIPRNAAASFGSIIHMALDRYNMTGNFDEAMEMFKDYWQNPEKVGEEPGYWPQTTSWHSYSELGENILKEYHEQQTKWDQREVIGTELKFKVPLGEHWVMGYIDLIDIKRSGKGVPLLRVTDYKTKYKQPTKAELQLDVQFTVYLWAIQQREFWCGIDGDPEFPGYPNGEELWQQIQQFEHRAIWYHLRTQKEIDAGERIDKDFMRLYRVCSEIEKAIDANVHMPKIGEACRLCDYRELCPLDIPDFSVDDEDANAWI